MKFLQTEVSKKLLAKWKRILILPRNMKEIKLNLKEWEAKLIDYNKRAKSFATGQIKDVSSAARAPNRERSQMRTRDQEGRGD